MSPIATTAVLWLAWIASWFLAAMWNRRVAARLPLLARLPDSVITVAGGLLIVHAVRLRLGVPADPFGEALLWRLPPIAGWPFTALALLGFAFTWWARLMLGDLWSGSVTRKERHVVVETGPYGLVRHPIYTGLILAAFAFAIQIGYASALVGAALMAGGFALKARLEERFLSAELGEAAYGPYRRRTPMLVPFWPLRD